MIKGQGRKLVCMVFLILGVHSPGHAAQYYVDASGGNDAAAGTRSAPWKTVKRVNRAPIPAGSTVFFRAGRSYGSSVLVSHSGLDGSPVTYTSYGTGTKPVLGGFDATGKSYAEVSGLGFDSQHVIINLTGAHHIAVNDCDIHSSATKWSPPVLLRSNARYNRITNCAITQEAGNCDTINFRGNADYNLIQGNTITVKGVHAAIDLEGKTGGGTAHYNVIKDNLIVGSEAGGALITLQADSSYNVIDGNTLTGDGTNSGYCGTNRYARHQTMFKVVSMNNIVRNNVIKNYPCQDSLGLTLEAYRAGGFINIATGNRVYHNVITGIRPGGTALFLGENGTGGQAFENVFKNNIVFNNGGTYYKTALDGRWAPDTGNLQMKVQVSSKVYGNVFKNNLFFKSGVSGVMGIYDGAYSVAQAQRMAPKLYSGNLQVDPLLDPVTQRPKAGSPAKGAGTFLTTVTSPSGSGRRVTVEDASYFTAGLGLVAGDTIQVGRQRITIDSIDYATNTLLLAGTISWTVGDTVSLPFSGEAPDIGLPETLPETSSQLPPALDPER